MLFPSLQLQMMTDGENVFVARATAQHVRRRRRRCATQFLDAIKLKSAPTMKPDTFERPMLRISFTTIRGWWKKKKNGRSVISTGGWSRKDTHWQHQRSCDHVMLTPATKLHWLMAKKMMWSTIEDHRSPGRPQQRGLKIWRPCPLGGG